MQMKFSFHYILHTSLIAANIYPSGKYYNLYQYFWLVLILILTLISTDTNLVGPDSIPGLVENNTILFYLQFAAPSCMNSEVFSRLFSSGICWIIVFTCFATSFILGKLLKKSDEALVEKINDGDEAGNVNIANEVKQQIMKLQKKLFNVVKKAFDKKKNPEFNLIV